MRTFSAPIPQNLSEPTISQTQGRIISSSANMNMGICAPFSEGILPPVVQTCSLRQLSQGVLCSIHAPGKIFDELPFSLAPPDDFHKVLPCQRLKRPAKFERTPLHRRPRWHGSVCGPIPGMNTSLPGTCRKWKMWRSLTHASALPAQRARAQF